MIVRIEQVFGDHHMHAFFAVYGLRNAQVPRKTAQHVGLLTADASALCDQGDHIPQCQFNTNLQIGRHAHGDIMGGCFCLRIGEGVVFEHSKAEPPLKRCLDSGHTDFAIALCAVAVTTGE